jgi:hypothetical protein
MFKENSILLQLATTPFTLRLIITILPEFKDSETKINKFHIYDKFK